MGSQLTLPHVTGPDLSRSPWRNKQKIKMWN